MSVNGSRLIYMRVYEEYIMVYERIWKCIDEYEQLWRYMKVDNRIWM